MFANYTELKNKGKIRVRIHPEYNDTIQVIWKRYDINTGEPLPDYIEAFKIAEIYEMREELKNRLDSLDSLIKDIPSF